jgi:hypothetical protein
MTLEAAAAAVHISQLNINNNKKMYKYRTIIGHIKRELFGLIALYVTQYCLASDF